jgi:hypothetical protein
MIVFHKVPEKYNLTSYDVNGSISSTINKMVINGDESDLRFLDPKGVIVGLKAKGKAKKDTTGFVK